MDIIYMTKATQQIESGRSAPPLPPLLRLEHANYPLNQADELLERGRDWLALNRRSFAERYVEGKVKMAFRWRPAASHDEHYLIFEPTKLARIGNVVLAASQGESSDAADSADDNQAIMPVYVRQGVDGPETVVSSFVRLQSVDEPLPDSREFPYFSFCSGQFIVSFASREREISIGGIGRAVGNGATTNEDIKGRPQLVERFAHDDRNLAGDRSLQ